MARPIYVEYALPLGIVFTLLGVVGLALSTVEFVDSSIFNIGGWVYYLLALALISLLVGVLVLYGYIKKVRTFNKLMQVKSKKEFTSILDDLEYTAWRLPSKFDAKVADKKKEFNVK